MHSNKYDVVNMNNNEYHMNNNARESQELHCIELLMLYIYIYVYFSHITLYNWIFEIFRYTWNYFYVFMAHLKLSVSIN